MFAPLARRLLERRREQLTHPGQVTFVEAPLAEQDPRRRPTWKNSVFRREHDGTFEQAGSGRPVTNDLAATVESAVASNAESPMCSASASASRASASLASVSCRFSRYLLASQGSSPHSPVAACMLESLRDDAPPLLDIVFDLKQRQKRPRAARSAQAGRELSLSNRRASAICPESAR